MSSKPFKRLMDETGVNRDFINMDMEWYYNGYLFHTFYSQIFVIIIKSCIFATCFDSE